MSISTHHCSPPPTMITSCIHPNDSFSPTRTTTRLAISTAPIACRHNNLNHPNRLPPQSSQPPQPLATTIISTVPTTCRHNHLNRPNHLPPQSPQPPSTSVHSGPDHCCEHLQRRSGARHLRSTLGAGPVNAGAQVSWLPQLGWLGGWTGCGGWGCWEL